MGYDSQITAAQAADALAVLTGTQPRITETDHTVRIEVDVTSAATAHWEQVLQVLDRGAAYGHTSTAASGPIAWMRLNLGDDHHS